MGSDKAHVKNICIYEDFLEVINLAIIPFFAYFLINKKYLIEITFDKPRQLDSDTHEKRLSSSLGLL